jgi:predicted dehydrogenase
MKTTLKLACVGAGYFSQFHYASWARIPRVRIVGSCDRDLEKAEATGYQAFSEVARMIEATKPDVLDVIVPPPAQAETIRTALALGVRVIICQKPFCRDLTEARAITAEAKALGARLVIHENFRFQPWYRVIGTALQDDRIGQVHQATFRLRPGDGQGSRAYLDRQPYFQQMERFLVHETAVHWIDTFRFLLGNPTGVYADLRRVNPAIAGEDAGYVLFDHPNGARALFDGNRHLDHAADNLRRTMGEALFEGTRGSIALTGDGAVRLRPFGSREVSLLLPPDRWEGFGGDCVHSLQNHVVAGLLDHAPLENEASDYLKVIAIEEAIYRSAGEGRKIRLETAE